MCNFLYLYISPSQTRDIFETFADKLELTLDTLTNKNPFLIVAIGDFNAKITNRYNNDTTSYKGLEIDAIISQFGLHQLISEPTHGVRCSLFSSSKLSSQLLFLKFNLKFFFQTPDEHEIWHYSKANIDLILSSINEFSWENRFSNTDANQSVYLMKKLRIFFLTL